MFSSAGPDAGQGYNLQGSTGTVLFVRGWVKVPGLKSGPVLRPGRGFLINTKIVLSIVIQYDVVQIGNRNTTKSCNIRIGILFISRIVVLFKAKFVLYPDSDKSLFLVAINGINTNCPPETLMIQLTKLTMIRQH